MKQPLFQAWTHAVDENIIDGYKEKSVSTALFRFLFVLILFVLKKCIKSGIFINKLKNIRFSYIQKYKKIRGRHSKIDKS